MVALFVEPYTPKQLTEQKRLKISLENTDAIVVREWSGRVNTLIAPHGVEGLVKLYDHGGRIGRDIRALDIDSVLFNYAPNLDADGALFIRNPNSLVELVAFSTVDKAIRQRRDAVPTAGRRPEKLDVLPVSAAEAIRAAIRHSNTVSSQAGFQRDFPPWQKRARREPSALLQVHGFTPGPSSSGGALQGVLKEREEGECRSEDEEDEVEERGVKRRL